MDSYRIKSALALVLLALVLEKSLGLKPELEQFICKEEERCRYIFFRNERKNRPLYCLFGTQKEIEDSNNCYMENICLAKNTGHFIEEKNLGRRLFAFLSPYGNCGRQPVCEPLKRFSGGYWKCQGKTRSNRVGPYTSCEPKCIKGKELERDFYVRCNESLLWEGLQTPSCTSIQKLKEDPAHSPAPGFTVPASTSTLSLVPVTSYGDSQSLNDHAHSSAPAFAVRGSTSTLSPVPVTSYGDSQSLNVSVPEAPINLTATQLDKRCIRLSWKGPTNNSGMVTRYSISYLSHQTWTKELQTEICGLEPNSYICFYVQEYTLFTGGKATKKCVTVADDTKDSGYTLLTVVTAVLVLVIACIVLYIFHKKRMCFRKKENDQYSDSSGSRSSCRSSETSESCGSSNHKTESTNLSKGCEQSVKGADTISDETTSDILHGSPLSNKEQQPLLDGITYIKETDCVHALNDLHVSANTDKEGKDEESIQKTLYKECTSMNGEQNCVVTDDISEVSENNVKREDVDCIEQNEPCCCSKANEGLKSVPVLNLGSFETNEFANRNATYMYDIKSIELESSEPLSLFSDTEDINSEQGKTMLPRENETNVTGDTHSPLYGSDGNLKFSNSNGNFCMNYLKVSRGDQMTSNNNPHELHLSIYEEGHREKPNMAQPESLADDHGRTQCNLSIQRFVDCFESAREVITKLGYKLDPDVLEQSRTWKGFAKNKLGYDEDRINATAHHTKGNPNNGHFMSLLEDMIALGITMGDIVEYFSREESRREDVLNLLFEHHPSCPYCDKKFKKCVKSS